MHYDMKQWNTSPYMWAKKKVCTQGEKVLLKTATYKNRMARKQSSTSGHSSQEMSVPSSPLMKYVFNITIFCTKNTWSTPSVYSGENLSEFEIYMLTRLFLCLIYRILVATKKVSSPKKWDSILISPYGIFFIVYKIKCHFQLSSNLKA